MTYTVRTPFLFWFGAVTLALTLAVVIATWGNWLGVFVLSTIFGGLGAALFFGSATISADAEGLTVVRIGSRKSVRWADLERIAAGGGNLVLYKKGRGRITAPSFEFWMGREKSELIALLARKLEEHAIEFRGNSFRALVQAGDR